jgi:hypothetical protein
VKIKLTEKYRPFSHEAGTPLLLPKSSWKVTPYPAKLLLEDLISKEKFEIIPMIEGPISTFTVMQDLEKGWVRIFGKGGKGFFSYRLVIIAHQIFLFVERCESEGLTFKHKGEIKTVKRKEELMIIVATHPFHQDPKEKVHFGSSKKQDWTLVKRRLHLEEILPIWFQLGKHLPKYPLLDIGTARLLKQCQTLIEEKNREKIGTSFIELFKTAFEGILCPRLIDTDCQGIALQDEISEDLSPLLLLSEGARLIRKLLIDQTQNHLSILPCLPKELHAGRFVAIDCGKNLTLDFEWSKKLIRRLALHPKEDQTLYLSFQKSITSFRLRLGRRGRGKEIPIGEPLHLKKDRLYILDHFQK